MQSKLTNISLACIVAILTIISKCKSATLHFSTSEDRPLALYKAPAPYQESGKGRLNSVIITSRPLSIGEENNSTRTPEPLWRRQMLVSPSTTTPRPQDSTNIPHYSIDCSNGKSCSETFTVESTSVPTFKSYSKDVLEKFLNDYGISKSNFAKIHNTMNTSTTKNFNENKYKDVFDNQNTLEASNKLTNIYLDDAEDADSMSVDAKSRPHWSLINAQQHNHPYDDRDGWVTLEAVPWSSSKISKWQSNNSGNKKPHWTLLNRPSTQDWDSEKPSKPLDRPQYSEKPYDRPQYTDKPYDRPQYTDKPYDRPQYTDKPYDRPQYTEKPYDRPQYTEKPYDRPQYTEKPYDKPQYTEKPYDRPLKPQFLIGSRPIDFSPQETPHTDRPISDYGNKPHQQWIISSHPDIITGPENWPNSRPGGAGTFKPWSQSDHIDGYEQNRRPIPTPVVYHDGQHPSNHPDNGEGEWILLSSTKGYSLPVRHSYQRALTLNPKPITSTKTVKLTVLPAVNGTANMTTSHGGMLEVESTFQSVDEAQQFDEMKKSNQTADLNKAPVRLVPKPAAQRGSGRAVLAAVGAGMLPATMALLVPMMLGRRKRSVVNIPTVPYRMDTIFTRKTTKLK
ncbi:hypothetical protein L9F63_004948 [Diploptera punctata]|uniref:Uncharacterized protein n=1 Tax=Diploptera punctata TaxID=6984 RepID=A0AAD7ZE11_DIPPU|nr:hypothetical protein L9F63_004948 [Diploptera punctata]